MDLSEFLKKLYYKNNSKKLIELFFNQNLQNYMLISLKLIK